MNIKKIHVDNVIGLDQAIQNNNFVVDATYVHTDNNYTTPEKIKLSNIEHSANAYNITSDIDDNSNTTNKVLSSAKTLSLVNSPKPTLVTNFSSLNSNRTIISSRTSTSILSADLTYNGFDIVIQAINNNTVHITKLLVIHNGVDVFLTEYGSVYTNSILGMYDALISGSKLHILATPTLSTSTTFVISAHMLSSQQLV